MNILKLLSIYAGTLLVFLIVDLVWLGYLAAGLYQKYIGSFLTDSVRWGVAFGFYGLFLGGIFIFAIYPAVQKNSLSTAIILGALFGFFTYATYDLTNLATLKGWPWQIVIIDILWGSFLTALVSVSGFYLTKLLY